MTDYGPPPTPINGRVTSLESRITTLETALGDVREKLGKLQGILALVGVRPPRQSQT